MVKYCYSTLYAFSSFQTASKKNDQPLVPTINAPRIPSTKISLLVPVVPSTGSRALSVTPGAKKPTFVKLRRPLLAQLQLVPQPQDLVLVAQAVSAMTEVAPMLVTGLIRKFVSCVILSVVVAHTLSSPPRYCSAGDGCDWYEFWENEQNEPVCMFFQFDTFGYTGLSPVDGCCVCSYVNN